MLTKHAMRKKLLYTKYTYRLKLLLNVLTVGIHALVSWNKFCMPVSKKSAAYEFSHVLTPSINSSLLLKSCVHNQFFRSVIVIGDIRSERDQYYKEGGQTTPSSNATALLVCEKLYAGARCFWRSITPDVGIPRLLF
jgi:hypothetical protein